MTQGEMWKSLKRDPLALVGLAIILVFALMALVGDRIAPYDPNEILRNEDGAVKIFVSPNRANLFGTTDLGRDVFSQVIVGARDAMFIGLWAAIVATGIGTTLGLLAGYFGRATDQIVSRLVEVTYSIPFEPLAIILLGLINPSLWTIILAISLVSWRQPTRVVRNQALTFRHGAFIKSARVAGASPMRIVFRHVAPLVLPVAFVYVPVAFGHAILAEASISFLGFGNPESISWGGVLRNAFAGGALDKAWWWILAPGLFITLASASMFFITRPFEELLNPRLRRL